MIYAPELFVDIAENHLKEPQTNVVTSHPEVVNEANIVTLQLQSRKCCEQVVTW